MPSASYYREQARLLREWARSLRATDPAMAARLEVRAHGYLDWAAAAELDNPTPEDRLGGAINAFNERQMTSRPAPITQQQQQIQPKTDDE